jgi:hypothetical protein
MWRCRGRFCQLELRTRVRPRLPFLPMKNPPERGCSGGRANVGGLGAEILSRSNNRAHTTYMEAGFSSGTPRTIEQAACRSFSQLQSWRPPPSTPRADDTAGVDGAK